MIGFASLGQLIAAAFALLTHRAAWPLLAATAIFLAVGKQISLGNDHSVSLHVPLGVALFGAQTTFLIALAKLARRRAARSRHALGSSR